MHHVIVTRVSVTLCLLLAACILGFALLVDRSTGVNESAEPAGAVLFRTHCGGCHGEEELTAMLRAAPDRPSLLAEWKRFLERHGRAGPEADRVILEYLESRQR